MYETRQNKEKVSRRIDSAGGGTRQRVKMENNQVKNKSVIQREGESNFYNWLFEYSKQTIFKDLTGYKGIWQGNNREVAFKTKALSVFLHSCLTNVLNIIKKNGLINQNTDIETRLAIQAYVAKKIGIANCGEYAALATNFLMKHTKEQYIYRCSIADFDHAFIVTSPIDLPIKNENGIRVFNIIGDVDFMIVVDPWGKREPVLFEDYIKGNNPYAIQFNIEQIHIRAVMYANNQSLLNKEIKQGINAIIAEQVKITFEKYNQYSKKEDSDIVKDIDESTKLYGPRSNEY